MALGRRKRDTGSLFIPTSELPKSGGHPFYRALNRLLDEAGFDRAVEDLCATHYSDGKGRPSIPPGIYFRMLFVGYFEGIDSQRGIAWCCADSLALREFLGVGLTGASPDHSSLTVIRQRLPPAVHEAVFELVLKIAQEKKLLHGKTLGIDSTFLEANAAMKSIVRKETGEDWKAYLRRLAQEAGIEDPSDDDLRRFDRDRGGKKVSNDDWQSESDPDSRMMRMKDGTTRLSYKAEHAVDLDSNLIVAATIQPGNKSDTQSLKETLVQAHLSMAEIEHDIEITEVVADRGYHSTEALTYCAELGLRTYVPPRKSRRRRRWTDKTVEEKRAIRRNDQRVRDKRGRALQRRRSERVERSFAHVCETGGARRSWLRGFDNVAKRYLLTVAAHNLGRICLALFGIGKPRGLTAALAAFITTFTLWIARWKRRIDARIHFDARCLVSLVRATIATRNSRIA